MTLFRQIAIAVSSIIIILVATIIYVNFQSVKKDMITNLYETSVNNISSLTNKLAQAGEDHPTIVTTIDAEFDSGYYKMIDYKATNEKLSYTKNDQKIHSSIPTWFVDFVDIKLEAVNADVTSGWSVLGHVTIQGDMNIVYSALYKIFFQLVVVFVVSIFVTLTILYGVLYFILKPLKMIEQQAFSIAQGKFEIIENTPFTTEIRNVTIAMNEMSTKIENMISKLRTNIEKMEQKLNTDDLTGLDLEKTFDTDMKKMFIEKSHGYVCSVKIHDLASYAKTHSNKDVDDLLIAFANILRNSSQKVTAYRFFGSEFAMIIKASKDEVENILSGITNKFDNLSKELHIENLAYIGGSIFNTIGTTANILAASKEACLHAQQIGPNAFYLRNNEDLARDMKQWKEIVEEIVDKKSFEIDYINAAYDLKDEKKLLMEEAFTKAYDKEGKAIPIGTFISVAEKYNKVIDFDKAVVNKIITHIKNENINHTITINLAIDSIKSAEFIHWLVQVIKTNQKISSQLAFSVTAYGVANNIEDFKNFVSSIHTFGAKVIIKRFETKFIMLDKLQDLNLDFVRLARDYTDGICKDKSKQAIVESLQELSSLLNIKVFAENVKDDDLGTVKSIGLFGASR